MPGRCAGSTCGSPATTWGARPASSPSALDPDGGPPRQQAGGDAGPHRDGDTEAESLQEAPGKRDAAGHAEQSQHHALDELLTQQTSPARPDRETQAS